MGIDCYYVIQAPITRHRRPTLHHVNRAEAHSPTLDTRHKFIAYKNSINKTTWLMLTWAILSAHGVGGGAGGCAAAAAKEMIGSVNYIHISTFINDRRARLINSFTQRLHLYNAGSDALYLPL